MQSERQEQIKQLMADQAEEAPLPTSYAMLREQAPEPETQEPPQDVPEPQEPDPEPEPAPDAESVPEPTETAAEPLGEIDPTEEPSSESGDPVAFVEPEGEREEPERPDPDWEDSIDDMVRQYSGSVEHEEYQPRQPGWEEETSWQQSLADRGNSI